MSFIKAWFSGYISPRKFAEGLISKPAPQWGFYAQLLRALMDSLLVYLPLFLMGKIPPTPPYISIFSTENYYGSLIWLTPLVFLAQWLIGAAFMHVCLRLLKQPSEMDQILNISGMATLVIGAFLVVWDWAWFFLGGLNQYTLGISHLVVDVWWIIIAIAALKKILGARTWVLLPIIILALAIEVPIAMLFMRSPF